MTPTFIPGDDATDPFWLKTMAAGMDAHGHGGDAERLRQASDEIIRLRMVAASDRIDADRWRALMSSQRMHWMGSAGFRHFNPDDPDDRTMQNLVSEVTAKPGESWMHFGMEFWDVHRAFGDPAYPDRFERQLLTLYVDTLRARMSGSTAGNSASTEYLDRFPPEARAHADRAYQDGYEDGVNSVGQEDKPSERRCPDCGGLGAHASSGEGCDRCFGGGAITDDTEAHRAETEPHHVGYRIAENQHSNIGFYVRPDDESSFSPATIYPTAEAAWAAFDEEDC